MAASIMAMVNKQLVQSLHCVLIWLYKDLIWLYKEFVVIYFP